MRITKNQMISCVYICINILQIIDEPISFLTKNLEKRKRKCPLQLAAYQSW